MSRREFRVSGEFLYNRESPVRWIISHLFRYPFFPFILVISAIINNAAFSNVQVNIGNGFGVITQPQWELKELFLPALAIVVSALIQGGTGLLRNLCFEFLAQRIERDTREELYISLLGKSQSFHGKQRIGDIMARATNDVRNLNYMFNPGIMLILDSVLAFIIPLFFIGFINPWLLVTPLIFAFFLVITVRNYNKRLKPVSFAQRELFGTMNTGLAEAIEGIEVVKSNVKESYEWKKFISDARQFKDYYVKQGIIQAKYWPMLVFAVCWGAAFFHSLWMWKTGVITIAQVIGFLQLFNAFRFATFISIFSFNLVQLGMASAERILSMINIETELDENPEGAQVNIRGKVTFAGVGFSFENNRVLDKISFTALPGETVALVGQTGSGKTTLTRLINRIFDATEGQVMVDDVDVRDWHLEKLRAQISFIEQDIFLYSKTIRENIAFGREDASREDIENAAREAQAHDFIMKFADGYETVIGERGVTLSGGQKQRLAIARAFLTNPHILILDDSTSAIDSATEDEIQKAMHNISRERTTFIITHRLSQIRWADKILVMKKGNLVAQGSHETLLKESRAYSNIFAQ